MKNDIAWKLQVKFPCCNGSRRWRKIAEEEKSYQVHMLPFCNNCNGEFVFLRLNEHVTSTTIHGLYKEDLLLIVPHQNVTFNLNNNFSFRSQKRKWILNWREQEWFLVFDEPREKITFHLGFITIVFAFNCLYSFGSVLEVNQSYYFFWKLNLVPSHCWHGPVE